MDSEQTETMNLLQGLLGKWSGVGVAEYPTISTFEYREEFEFAANETQPVLHFEQRTWKKLETGEFVPSHWESGFWRVRPEKEIEFLSAQIGGRVEVSHGVLSPTSGGFVLHLQSTLVANDPRMGQTEREFVLQNKVFRYSMKMCTTLVPELTLHNHAELIPCAD
jgi:hypothetical protein